jgi:hypothetical protein
METIQTRYFFFTAMGKAPNGNLIVNQMGLQTEGDYPTMKSLLDSHNQKHTDLRETLILGITEMSSDDWDKFVSEQ